MQLIGSHPWKNVWKRFVFQEILRCKNSGTLGLFTTQTMQLKWKWDQQIELNLLTLLNYHQKVFSVKKNLFVSFR